MTDQNMIPAEKVRELADKYDNAPGNPDRLLVNAIADLRALLPDPPQPAGGLLGRWAKHPEHGDVVCVAERPASGLVKIAFQDNCVLMSVSYATVTLDSLTFPEQATKPEDVPAGEAWLVNLNGGKHTRVVALKTSHDTWRIGRSDSIVTLWGDEFVELVYPLTPERPESDLQAKYDDLEKRWKHLDDLYSARGSFIDELRAKYREAQERIKTLEQASTPRTVTTEAEYAALPAGSVVAQPGELDVYAKNDFGGWDRLNTTAGFPSLDLAGSTRMVLRYGWGDEQPVWRIEHDLDGIRAGEFVIDKSGDSGIARFRSGDFWKTYGWMDIVAGYGPFIVFPNRDAATPEAIEEAKNARDEEMYK